MAEKKSKKEATTDGEVYELKDKDTGFYDAETEYKIVRNEQVAVGETIGKATNLAIQSGRLLLVKDAKKTESDFPKNFPGSEKFISSGVTFEQVKKFTSDEDALKVNGITPEIIEQIKTWFKDNPPKK